MRLYAQCFLSLFLRIASIYLALLDRQHVQQNSAWSAPVDIKIKKEIMSARKIKRK